MLLNKPNYLSNASIVTVIAKSKLDSAQNSEIFTDEWEGKSLNTYELRKLKTDGKEKYQWGDSAAY